MFKQLIDSAKWLFYVDFKSLKYGYGIYLLFFIMYIEFGSGLGGVWLRKNSLNNTVFLPGGIVNFLTKPFHNTFFWRPRFWDINYYIGGYIMSNIIYKINLIK